VWKRASVICRSELTQRDASEVRWYDMETEFLQQREQRLQVEMDEMVRRSVEEESAAVRHISNRNHHLGLLQREAELASELLKAAERKHSHLECIIGTRLRQADRQLADVLGNNPEASACDDRCRAVQRERQALIRLLDEWWQWLGRAQHVGDKTTDSQA